MRKMRVWMMWGCCGLAAAALAWGQIKQQPGLWEVTTQMSMAGAPQVPQMPAGVQLPPGMSMPASPFAPHTTQVCVTQAMIDKYGAPYSNPQRGNCKVSNVTMKPNGMSADIACTGQMSTTGTVESTWSEAGSVTTKVHMTGTMQMGQNSRPVDMTVTSTSAYKGADCGSVQPMAMPTGN
jgi:hypothetical protein